MRIKKDGENCMSRETYQTRLNGEKRTVTVFYEGDRVRNYSGAEGFVEKTNGLLTYVNWDENSPNNPGKIWLATSLTLLN
ncbi:hypothetical protein [Sporosarcina sp. P37]|uniref:hypothetical protein n=2 Tax=unclassified Sporosarcina TaxID=2647733 RepID=UPI001180FFF5|nr:hypothetical protein [Sporosarcina sp. P37]